MQYLKFFILALLSVTCLWGCDPQKENWEGKYSYEESANSEAAQVWVYQIEVYRHDNNLYANVAVDGFQTSVNLKCDLLVNPEGAKFVVSKIEEGNFLNAYKIGDLLFELKKPTNSKIITRWEKMEPNLIDSPNEGVFFVRSK